MRKLHKKALLKMKIKNLFLQIYFLVRLPYICLLRLLFRPGDLKPEKINKILIVRIDRMGDLILTLPVIDNLKLKYPQAAIDVLVRPYLKDLALLETKINKVIIYDNGASRAKARGAPLGRNPDFIRGLKAAVFERRDKISSWRRLRQEKYDMALDMLCDYRLDSAFLAFITGAGLRAGFSGGFREILFNQSVDCSGNLNKSMVELNLEILKRLDIPVPVTVPVLRVKSDNARKDFLIAIHPGGYYESQRWLPERFVNLAKNILGAYTVKLLIIGSESEKMLVDSIVSGIGNSNATAAYTGMKDLALLLSECKLLICNNSGPLHLAAALGVPTVSTMGPSAPARWYPQGDNNLVIRKTLSCSPCSRAKCKGHECMDLITVEEVHDAVKSLMLKVYGIK